MFCFVLFCRSIVKNKRSNDFCLLIWNLHQIWETYKERFGSLFCSYLSSSQKKNSHCFKWVTLRVLHVWDLDICSNNFLSFFTKIKLKNNFMGYSGLGIGHSDSWSQKKLFSASELIFSMAGKDRIRSISSLELFMAPDYFSIP